MKINHEEDYALMRAKEYPPIADQLDALWKEGQEQIDMKNKVDEIKKKFPKPIQNLKIKYNQKSSTGGRE